MTDQEPMSNLSKINILKREFATYRLTFNSINHGTKAKGKTGKFELADQANIFTDEIGYLQGLSALFYGIFR